MSCPAPGASRAGRGRPSAGGRYAAGAKDPLARLPSVDPPRHEARGRVPHVVQTDPPELEAVAVLRDVGEQRHERGRLRARLDLAVAGFHYRVAERIGDLAEQVRADVAEAQITF